MLRSCHTDQVWHVSVGRAPSEKPQARHDAIRAWCATAQPMSKISQSRPSARIPKSSVQEREAGGSPASRSQMTGHHVTYAIVGFGAVGQALARTFARKGMEVMVASTRPPEALAPLAREIGPTVVSTSLQDALEGDIVLLAVPFPKHHEVAKSRPSWQGTIVVDVMNAYGVPVEELGGLPSSAAVARALPGARLVKGFNHLGAKTLGADPDVKGGRRVVFLSSDDEQAAAQVKALAEELGFAPIWLGKLAEGGALVQARGQTWAPLIFQDLVKFDNK